MEYGHKVHAIYLDFAKIFDKVNHQIILTKAYGIPGKIHRWISTSLTIPTQQVRVGEYLSDEVCVLSGVPQGSVLGPFLFIMHMNDITDELEGMKIGICADDTKAWQITEFEFTQKELNKM